MCENIKIHESGDDYEEAVLNAMLKLKDSVPADHQVFRDPHQCGREEDWFLAHSECEISAGGTQIGGTFVFRRNYDEYEHGVE